MDLARSVRIIPVYLFLFVYSCAPPQPEERFTKDPVVQVDLNEIRQRGFITALVDNNSVSYFIYKGNSLGYEYELLKRLADDLKVDLRIRLIVNIEEAMDLLNIGAGDIIAFPLTVTEERKQYITFTKNHFTTTQVLIQRKTLPEGDSVMAESAMIRTPNQLIGKDVYVKKGSSFKEQLEEISKALGGTINVKEDNDDEETEALIRKVALGEIQYTVNDKIFASVNATYYPELDIQTEIGVPQQIAWAVRKNSPELLEATNVWLTRIKRKGTFRIIYEKYFNSPRTSFIRMNSNFSSLSEEGKLSRYDDQIKEGAKDLGWDWRLLAAMIYQESHFNPHVESWAGAVGLMQLMPGTLAQYHVRDPYNPEQSLQGGVRFLKYLDRLWGKTVKDSTERVKFVLASYNVGLSHVVDARNLTRKYGKNPVVWDGNVEFYLVKKSISKYYRDPVTVAGYCRCTGPVAYVKEVLDRYEEYKTHFTQ